jgi:preprotein translocase subunit SecB
VSPDLIVKAGFQQLLLPPTNFVQIYHNKKNSPKNEASNKSLN